MEYAHRHARDYDHIGYVRSETRRALVQDLIAFGLLVRALHEETAEREGQTHEVLRWLEHRKRWLLVYDNARSAAALRPYLPAGGAGHILITSQSGDWQGTAVGLALPPFSAEEAIAFVLDRSGKSERAGAERIVARVGELPLALDQAAAFVAQSGQSLDDYADALEERPASALQEHEPPTPGPTANPVGATWRVAFERVAAAEPAAGELLRLCAFLPADEIPVEALRRERAHLPQILADVLDDPVAWNRLVALLQRYALLRGTPRHLIIHRLAQEEIIRSLTGADRRHYAGRARRLPVGLDLRTGGTALGLALGLPASLVFSFGVVFPAARSGLFPSAGPAAILVGWAVFGPLLGTRIKRVLTVGQIPVSAGVAVAAGVCFSWPVYFVLYEDPSSVLGLGVPAPGLGELVLPCLAGSLLGFGFAGLLCRAQLGDAKLRAPEALASSQLIQTAARSGKARPRGPLLAGAVLGFVTNALLLLGWIAGAVHRWVFTLVPFSSEARDSRGSGDVELEVSIPTSPLWLALGSLLSPWTAGLLFAGGLVHVGTRGWTSATSLSLWSSHWLALGALLMVAVLLLGSQLGRARGRRERGAPDRPATLDEVILERTGAATGLL